MYSKHIEKFQYLTREGLPFTAVQQAEWACLSGAKWLQYRSMDKSDAELLEDIEAIASICDDWGCTLLVTNHFHLAGKADIQGFHIEDMQADMRIIRQQIGDEYILGASANDLQTLINHADNGADYVSLGPYGHTDTKPNQSPHIGLEGYRKAITALKNQDLQVPIFAVGGIQLKDVEAILATGIQGIAVSKAIYGAANFSESYQQFHQLIY